jgi:MFS family permease
MNEIHKIYLSQFLSGFAMLASFTPLYFLSQGISQSQLGILISANILALSLFDVPTGAIADTFGHKNSVFLGTLIWSFSYLLLFIVHGFLLFLLCMVIGGLGLALISGAFTSLVYDILSKLDKKNEFTKVYGRSNGFFLIASVISAFIGGYIYQYDPKLIFLITFLFTFIGALSVLFIKSNIVMLKPTLSNYINKMVNGVTLTVNNKSLLSLVVLSIGLSFGIFVINNIKQPYLINNGMTVVEIGYITALVSGISAIIYLYGHIIIRRFTSVSILIGISVIAVLSLVLIGATGSWSGLSFLIIFQLLPSLRDPALSGLQQKHIEDDQRATVNSTVSFLSRLVIAFALPVWGIVIDKGGINRSLIYLASLTFALTFFGLLFYRKYSTTIVKKHCYSN